MRIVAGYAGGIHLTAPKSDAVRPTTDRIREALFATLGDLTGMTVVDLFAGTGAIGLEAWSRGATVTLVEQDPRTVGLIRRNEAAVLRAMPPDSPPCRIVRGDALKSHLLLPHLKPDLLLADPPYRSESGPTLGTRILQDRSFAAWAGDAMMVLEQSTHSRPDLTGAHWRIEREKRYGDILLLFLRPTVS